MKIQTNNKERYEGFINKYYSKKKQWDVMRKTSRITFLISAIFLIGFYIFAFAYVGIKLFGRDAGFVFRYMMIFLIVALIFIALTGILEWKRYEMPTNAKIWNSYRIFTKNGFQPFDIAMWIDSDKIHCHLIYKNDKGKEMYDYIRVDDFSIKFADIEEPEVLCDDYEIIIPNSRLPFLS